MRTSEYEHLYMIKNVKANKFVLYYWASSQKHKALFSTKKKAEQGLHYIERDEDYEGTYEIIEI